MKLDKRPHDDPAPDAAGKAREAHVPSVAAARESPLDTKHLTLMKKPSADSAISMKSVRVGDTDVDVVRMDFDTNAFEKCMSDYIFFHTEYMSLKPRSSKTFFIYDISNVRVKDVVIKSVHAFTTCHRNCSHAYVDFLVGTFVIMDSKPGALAQFLIQTLKAVYTPVRPLRITGDPSGALDFMKTAMHQTTSEIENDFAAAQGD